MAKKPGQRQSAFTEPGSASAIQRIVQQSREAQAAEETGPGYGRGRPGNAGELGVDSAQRTKATYDISKTTQTALRQIAEDSGISIKSLAEAALRGFANGVLSGSIDLSEFQVRARSLKAEWELELPDDFVLFLERRQH